MKVEVMKPMMMLPPRPDLCQTCAWKHEHDQPHNPTTLYYMMKFKMDTGKEATWADAMSHCSDEVKAHWTKHLKKLHGIDVNSTRLRGTR